MRIERIKIDGFGRFERYEEKLEPGLNVIFGENEAGKSTLLSFVRATLFGFSKRTEPSRYEPERGLFGGELLLDTDGGPLWVRRVGSRRRYEGELSLRTGSGDRALPSRLSEAIGGISRQLFFQVFAFGLSELAAFDQLAEQGEVAEALLAAGMRGAKRLPYALDELRRSSEVIYTPKGRRELNQLLGELEQIQEELRAIGDRPAEYFQELEQLTAIEKKLLACAEQIDGLSTERSALAKLSGASEDLSKLEQLERELKLFPPLDAFPPDATRELEKLCRGRSDAAAEVCAAKAEREALCQAAKAIEVSPKWWAAEDEIRAALDGFRPKMDQLRCLASYSAENSLKQRELLKSLGSLGLSLALPEIVSLDLGAPARDQLRALSRQLQSARSRLAAAQERAASSAAAIERAEQEVVRLSAEAPAAPRTTVPRRIVPTLWMLLAAVVVAGPVLFSMPITWVAIGVTALVSAVLFLFERWAAAVLRQALESFEASQALAAQRLASLADAIGAAGSQKSAAEQEQADAAEDLTRLSEQLVTWLAERKLPPRTSPERAMELWAELSLQQLRLGDLLAEKQVLAADERVCAAAKERLENAVRSAELKFGDGAEELLAAASSVLDRLAQARESRCRLAEQMEANAARQARADRQAAEVEGLVAQLLEQGGCATEQELRIRDRQAAAFRALKAQERDLALRIEATTGSSAATAREGIAARGGPQAIVQSLETLDRQRERLDADKADLAERRGRCRAQLERWEEDREIAGLRAREERRRGEAAGLAAKYAVDRLALRLLLEAQRRFEQEQQPRILKLASRAFQELTGGRYVRVHASATQPGSLRVDSADGGEWRDEQLSRGTREQLYLAFRLAVIEDFGETRLALPILLDDVLVNFDRQRAQNVVKGFARLSARHQVIAFTCHEPVRELFAQQGARVIEVARDRLGLLAVSA
jgi:uncharacterized protein YhaN